MSARQTLRRLVLHLALSGRMRWRLALPLLHLIGCAK